MYRITIPTHLIEILIPVRLNYVGKFKSMVGDAINNNGARAKPIQRFWNEATEDRGFWSWKRDACGGGPPFIGTMRVNDEDSFFSRADPKLTVRYLLWDDWRSLRRRRLILSYVILFWIIDWIKIFMFKKKTRIIFKMNEWNQRILCLINFFIYVILGVDEIGSIWVYFGCNLCRFCM